MEHEEFVKAYVNDEWLSWEDATALAHQRDEDAKEQFLASVFAYEYQMSDEQWRKYYEDIQTDYGL